MSDDLNNDAINLLCSIKRGGRIMKQFMIYNYIYEIRLLEEKELITVVRDDGASTLFLTELGVAMKEMYSL